MKTEVEQRNEDGYGYPLPYYEAWDAMIATGRYWAMAPIHHGVFENGWKAALERAADMVKHDPVVAAQIRALGVYTDADDDMEQHPTTIMSGFATPEGFTPTSGWEELR